jgi:hypothetical protein
MKWSIFKNLSLTIKKIESMACYVWGKPNTKSMPTFIHKALGIGSGVYNLAFNKAFLDL